MNLGKRGDQSLAAASSSPAFRQETRVVTCEDEAFYSPWFFTAAVDHQSCSVRETLARATKIGPEKVIAPFLVGEHHS